MSIRVGWLSRFSRTLQLALTLFITAYILFVGGRFNASIQHNIQLLNAAAATFLFITWLLIKSLRGSALRLGALEWSVAALAGSFWLATAFSAQPRLSAEESLTLTAWLLAFIVLRDILDHGWPEAFLINGLILAGIVVAAQLLWETVTWYAAWVSLGSLPAQIYRVGGISHPNLSAGLLNLVLPLVLAKSFQSEGRFGRNSLWVLAGLMLIAEFFTSSRAGWIGAFVTLLTFFGLTLSAESKLRERLQYGWRQLRALPSPIQITASLMAGGVLIIVAWALWRQTLHPSHPDFINSRQYIWSPAWAIFTADPLTGSGPGLFGWRYSGFTSIPPAWLAPHAHNLALQVLSGAGLLGFFPALACLITGSLRVTQKWQSGQDRIWTAAYIGSLTGLMVHHFFDYLFFGTPAFVFVVVVICALAFRPVLATQPVRPFHPLSLGAPAAILIGLSAWWLRAAELNAQGVQLANQGSWAEAAARFQEAAEADPGFTLYWQNAALAASSAGQIDPAISLWQRTARDDPFWAPQLANLAIVQRQPSTMEAALTLAPDSHLFALNAAVLCESQGDLISAEAHYRRALDLSPASAQALFWQQTSLRQQVLLDWEQTQSIDASSIVTARAALENGDPQQALVLLQPLAGEETSSPETFTLLARAYWANGDESRALYYMRIARLAPLNALAEFLEVYTLEGDWAEAHGDRAAARSAYLTAFSIVNDYTSMGPGSYGHTERTWFIYHRETLPNDLGPGFARADITLELDARFAKLASWLVEDNQSDTACFILNRLHREAPVSISGSMWESQCISAQP